ncbi:MAG: glycosyltransferase family 2 protein [Lachnospiraceae bacterium]|nr:glycosyltransferase family 2 protein [Lachnospiraceae bacterium]
MDISVVIPVYGCKKALEELYRRLTDTLSSLTDAYEIILVDDHCPQGSWEIIEQLCRKDRKVTGIRLSRNFGQIRAITAGLDQSMGEWVVVMDCDLQDRPEHIRLLYEKAQEGYDVVFGRRMDRKDTFLKKAVSGLFYKIYNYFTDGNFDNNICNYSIIHRKVADQYCSMREQNRAYTLFIKWLGFREAVIDLEADERFEGKSSYNFKRRIRFALELITAQSNKPLLFAVKLGFFISFAALLYIIYVVILFFTANRIVEGWTTIVASVYLMGGFILSTIGIVGIYVGNIFNETKGRPIYVVGECMNDHKKAD